MKSGLISRVVPWMAITWIFFIMVQNNSAAQTVAVPESESVEMVLDVAPVWAGHPVGFALLTHKNRQFVAFYDAQRQMTVAMRDLARNDWSFAVLPESVGWDSHNYITMAVDDNDCVHVSGNMHAHPLKYFRTTKPLDIGSFERVPKMTGQNEDHVTYPVFLRGAQNEFLFTYRDGSSGNGNQIYNVYDHKTGNWKRLLDRPLFDGQGQRNAYPTQPLRGPDGFFHIAWVWRETPDCSTNHDPSYARSRDLVHWETSSGQPLVLPITLADSDIVDPIAVGGGVINGNLRLGFDAQKRVIVSYHKHDAQGHTQIYNTRCENGVWKPVAASHWDYRWNFSGGGSIVFEIGLGVVRVEPDGSLSQTYSHQKFGSGTWVLDADTLQVIGEKPHRPAYPPAISNVESPFENMKINWAADKGSSGEPNVRYVLRWETLPQNRDRLRTGELPPPSMLRLYKLLTPVTK